MDQQKVQTLKQRGGPLTEPQSLLRSASAMGAATFLSRIFGLIREQVFAYLFGAGNAMDAYTIAFRIPNLLRDLFAEGAMSASFVPTFVRVREDQGNRDAWRVAGLVFRVLAIGVSLLTLVGIGFAPGLVGLYASPFKLIPGKFELTVTMTRQIFPFFPMVVLAAAFMGVLNACNAFFMPAFASALFNVVSVATGVVFSWFMPRFGHHPIEGMALGVVAGGMAQAFSQLPLLYKKGYFWPKRENQDPAWYQDPNLRRMLWMMIPGTLGLAATQINILVNSILATRAGPGSVSWLNYAFRLMQFPIGIFGVSLATATLPRVAGRWVKQDFAGFERTVGDSLRRVVAINLPCAIGLIALGAPILQLIFEYGRFHSQDTRAASQALAAYAVGLTAYSAVKVLVPVFYAMENTKIPVISSILSVLFNLTLNLLLVRKWGFWGLALGTSVTAFMNFSFLFLALKFALREKNQRVHFSPLVKFFTIVLGVSGAMGVICYYSHLGLSSLLPDGTLGLGKMGLPLIRAIRVLPVIAEGGLILVLFGKILKVKELSEPVDMVMNRFIRRPKGA